MRLALFEPDIPQNTGALLRLGACLGVPVDIIEPCGFHLDDRRLRRAGMDYLDQVRMVRHPSWQAFQDAREGRLVLLTTAAPLPYTEFAFRTSDTLLVGRESAGVPPAVHEAAAARVVVPMRPAMRSINVALAAAIVLGEALRQTGGFPAAPESGEQKT
ncbi:MAG: tRNA (cytidine(34)-2'-O)-methyltransferase [Rhodospirillales bacterium]|nr:tRNA (cytidine(34)-2'-O)-methyltransferase [Rhodospirillales bacterium]